MKIKLLLLVLLFSLGCSGAYAAKIPNVEELMIPKGQAEIPDDIEIIKFEDIPISEINSDSDLTLCEVTDREPTYATYTTICISKDFYYLAEETEDEYRFEVKEVSDEND